jgi:RimJ/RimL family protein N-acetyltransferase
LEVKRVTAVTGRKNKKARKALEVMGFVLEGNMERGLDGFENALIYGLLRENCRWIMGTSTPKSPPPPAPIRPK